MDYLNDMPLFVEVVKARSFRGAAANVGVPTSTLSRRIALLERKIGLRLLNRTTRRIELTEAGQTYFERCKRIIDEARIAHEELGAMLAQPSGALRISAPADYAILWLAPLLKEFAVLYPSMEFELDLTPRNVDLVSEPFDLAIRMAKPEANHLITRVIGRVTPQLYAAPGYLAAHGTPAHPVDLEHHECLTMPTLRTWELHSEKETFVARVGGRFQSNSVALLRRLAVQEAGLLFLPEKAVALELSSGALKAILPSWQGPPAAIHAVTETRLLPAKTQRFIDFLKERLRE